MSEDRKSNEYLAQEISYVKERLVSIEKKLDEKYVSHETFDLVVKGLRADIISNKISSEEADTRLIKTAMFFATPLYISVIALLFKILFN